MVETKGIIKCVLFNGQEVPLIDAQGNVVEQLEYTITDAGPSYGLWGQATATHTDDGTIVIDSFDLHGIIIRPND